MITTKQQFIHFLKQNNVYEKYMFNFQSQDAMKRRISWHIPSINFFEEVNASEFIANAFVYSNTKEGYTCWSIISLKWRKKLLYEYKWSELSKNK